MGIVTTDLTLIQDVLGNSAGGFLDGGVVIGVASLGGLNVRYGMRFQFPGLQFSSTGFVLDPPLVQTANLIMQITNVPATAVPVFVMAFAENQPSAFAVSTDLFPATTRLRSVLSDNSAGGRPEFQVVAAGSSGTLTFPINPGLLMSCMHQIRTSQNWGGFINLLLFTREGPNENLLLELATIEGGGAPILRWVHDTRFHTGFETSARIRAARAVHSARTGEPILSDEAVEDGYLDGIWVAPHDWDPEDEFEHDEYVPSPFEGSTDGLPLK